MEYNFTVVPESAGNRLDHFLHQNLPQFSRTHIQQLIEQRVVLVNDVAIRKSGYKIKVHDRIAFFYQNSQFDRTTLRISSKIGIKVIAEHQDFIIIYKPAGIVVHPPQETYKQVTLVDWLIAQYPHLATVGDEGRAGVVHRLDADTSGLMIVVMHNKAFEDFQTLFKARKIAKTYEALVMGHPVQQGVIDYKISRHPVHKHKRYSAKILQAPDARDAHTAYEVVDYFEDFSLVRIYPKTGRTHQIRVHFQALGHALLGDALYGTSSKLLPHHALQAVGLAFSYQAQEYEFRIPLDIALQKVVDMSRKIEANEAS